jgi:uncharacterized protein (TIGR03118 family)
MRRRLITLAAVVGTLVVVPAAGLAHPLKKPRHAAVVVHQTNLVSNTTDSDLINAWGLASSPTSPFWVADNGTGLSTLYNGAGTKLALKVTIPPPAGSPAGTLATPTGAVFNNTSDFKLANGNPALFVFATEDGTISAWNGGTAATLEADNSTRGAVYKGLALGSTSSGNFLYATNFHAGTVDVFNASFGQMTLPAGAFVDRKLPHRYAPFDIANIGGNLYVTYAKQDKARHDDVAGKGNGYIDEYDTSGALLRRFASKKPLDSPWGMAVAPSSFGSVAGDLLVGNFGDGRINAFNLVTRHWDGSLQSDAGGDLVIDGLWGLRVGNAGPGFDPSKVYFSAGPNDEQDGLFGSLTPSGG